MGLFSSPYTHILFVSFGEAYHSVRIYIYKDRFEYVLPGSIEMFLIIRDGVAADRELT